MIAATILMDRLEAEFIGISSEFGKRGFDLCLGLAASVCVRPASRSPPFCCVALP